MKLESASVAVEPRRVTRNGRRYFSAEHKRRVVEQCLQPGASVAGIALEHGFNANLVRKWIQAYQSQRARQQRASRALVPVTVRDTLAVPTRTPRRARRRTPATAARPAQALLSSAIEIQLGAVRIVVREALDRHELGMLLDVILERAR